jgi:hypothetical protein
MNRRLAAAFGPIVFLAVWGFFMLAGQTRLFMDPGTQWHTRVGERILQHGFTTDEPFSFTFSSQRWIPHQWLGEAAMAILDRIGGFDLFLAGTAASFAALFAWLTLRLARTGLNPAVCIMIMMLGLASAALHAHIRPMLITPFALVITYTAFLDFEAARIPRSRLFWLIPLYLIWTNVHGGMLGGLASMILVTTGWIVWHRLGLNAPIKSARQSLFIIAIIISCSMTAVVTPYGTGIVRVWLKILNQPNLAHLIEEHKPLDVHDPLTWPLLILAAVYLLVLAGVRFRPSSPAWLLPVFWLMQSITHIRHAPLFALTAIVAIAAMWPYTRWAERLAKSRPDLYDPAHPLPGPSRWSIILALMIMVLGAAAWPKPVIDTNRPQSFRHLDPKTWPVDLHQSLKDCEPQSADRNNIFNDCVFGGFLIYHYPGYKIFIDDRAELYGEAFLSDYVMADANVIPRWEAQFGQFDFALLKPDSALIAYYDNHAEWQRVGDCPAAVFYMRKR